MHLLNVAWNSRLGQRGSFTRYSGYNNSVNAVETERGGTWMNEFDGGMMDTLWIEMGWLVDWGFRFLSL